MAPAVGPARHPLREKQAKDAVPPLSSLVAFFVRTASSSSFTASAPLLSAAAAIARAKPTAPPRMLSHSCQRAPPQALASTAPWTARTEPGAPLSRTFPGAARAPAPPPSDACRVPLRDTEAKDRRQQCTAPSNPSRTRSYKNHSRRRPLLISQHLDAPLLFCVLTIPPLVAWPRRRARCTSLHMAATTTMAGAATPSPSALSSSATTSLHHRVEAPSPVAPASPTPSLFATTTPCTLHALPSFVEATLSVNRPVGSCLHGASSRRDRGLITDRRSDHLDALPQRRSSTNVAPPSVPPACS
jgi:hypothetical protein